MIQNNQHTDTCVNNLSLFFCICIFTVLLRVTLNTCNSPLWSRLMMKNDEMKMMKKSSLQYELEDFQRWAQEPHFLVTTPHLPPKKSCVSKPSTLQQRLISHHIIQLLRLQLNPSISPIGMLEYKESLQWVVYMQYKLQSLYQCLYSALCTL